MSAPRFDVEPWGVAWSALELKHLHQAESVFAQSNGAIGWRANLDEGEPDGTPGSYLNGLFERWPLTYAERGYGDPSDGESLINAPDGKVIRLFVDGEPLDVRAGELRRHVLRLDFRSGILCREVEWVSPAGRGVRLTSRRLVSFTEPAVAAVRYEVEALQADTRIVVESELGVDEQGPPHGDESRSGPRANEALKHPLLPLSARAGERPMLVHRTRGSGIAVAAAMEHSLPASASVITTASEYVARATIRATLQAGEALRIDKFVAMACAADREELVAETADAALGRARGGGWEGLVERQREFLDRFWSVGDVELDGDERLQQAVRFAVFHTLQATVRADGGRIPNKGLTGRGYDGHAFWETETFVLPVLDYLLPSAATEALRWRHSTLPAARRRARELGQAGAMFAWRTVSGHENSGYWPASTAAVHVNADIAHAAVRHVRASDDSDFERDIGMELLVETARLWLSLGRWDAEGGFHIDGVTGPDEYSALADDNVYTNLMAQENLHEAARTADRHPEQARRLGITDSEPQNWRQAARAMSIPSPDGHGVHPQARGFTDHEEWDFDSTPAPHYPLQDHYPYFELYRRQVVKQPDLVLALYLRSDAFTREERARNFAYYEARTVRDSSLAASTNAILAAEFGHLDLALDYLREGAFLDLDDLHKSTSGGLHLGCLAGVWLSVAAGFGGLRCDEHGLSFAPTLPPGIPRLAFGIHVGADTIRIELADGEARYRLSGGSARRIRHHGTEATLEAGRVLVLPLVPIEPVGPTPQQPAGRSPRALLRGG